jgi:regulatory protein
MEPEDDDDLIGLEITALKPTESDPMRVGVRVGRRLLGVIDRGAISELGLRKGAVVDDAMIRRVRTAATAQACRSRALRLLAFKPRSRQKLIDDLTRAGHEPGLAVTTADRMVELGLVNDAQLAEILAREIVSRKPAGRRFLVGKLRQRGFEPALAGEVAARVAGERDSDEDALRLALKKARTLPKNITPEAARRRVFGALARRGFDMQVARQAVERAFGERDTPENE